MVDNPRLDDLRRRVQQDPASIAFAQLAEEYRRAGQHDQAVQTSRAGLEIHPGYLSARVTLGRALLALGRLDAAQRELELVLVSSSDNLAAIRGLADIAQRRGAPSDALRHYRRALDLAHNDPELQQAVADLTRQLARNQAPAGVPPSLLASSLPAPASLAIASAPVEPNAPADAVRAADAQTMATLTRWLTAIDGSRAERRA